MKSLLSFTTRRKILFLGAISSLCTFSALGQNAAPVAQIGPNSTASGSSAKGIGPAPVNTKQHQILSSALSSQTRQTLQEAMNSVPVETAPSTPSTK